VTCTEGGRGSEVSCPRRPHWIENGETWWRLTTDRKLVARTKCTGKVRFIAAWAEGGWDGQDGSALAASARPCPISSARMNRHRRHSERLLPRCHVEATRAWHCPLAAGGGEVDGALEPRRATRHDGECQHTLSTRPRACEQR
jgi:hypothetical protein